MHTEFKKKWGEGATGAIAPKTDYVWRQSCLFTLLAALLILEIDTLNDVKYIGIQISYWSYLINLTKLAI